MAPRQCVIQAGKGGFVPDTAVTDASMIYLFGCSRMTARFG